MSRLPEIVTDPDIIASYNQDALGLKGNFSGLVRPSSEEEIVDLIRYASSKGIKITPQGQRTSLTGAAIAEEGLALSLEKMNRIIDIDTDSMRAIVEPGLITGNLKRELAKMGLIYPPDPTSQDECTIGGNVATNASGSRSLRYGPTSDWVSWIRFVDGRGEVNEIGSVDSSKSSSGPRAFQRPLNLFVGSEGIFGVITKIGLKLTRAPLDSFVLVVYFRDLYKALDFVSDSLKRGQVPSSMEFMDEACIGIVKDVEGFYAPEGTNAIVTIEEELWDGESEEGVLDNWFGLIGPYTDLVDETIVLKTAQEKRNFANIRHRIPEALNEESNRVIEDGGIKISTDWAVPLPKLREMVGYFERIRGLLGDMPVYWYGHIGNGHPHVNIIARDKREREIGEQVELLLAQKAVNLGGVVSAEHGIGKLKKAQLRLMYPPCVLESLRAVKKLLDPKGILAPGNLL